MNRAVTYASAGHNPMILYRGGQDATYFLKPKGIPVGIDALGRDLFRKTISVEKLTLRQDDMLVIYTDGITEAMNPQREQFGEGAPLAAIKRHGHGTAQEFADALNQEIQEFTAGALQNDDITLVAIKERRVEERLEETRREPSGSSRGQGVGRRGMRPAPRVTYHLLPLPAPRTRLGDEGA